MNKLLKFIRGEANLIKQHMVMSRPTCALNKIFNKEKSEKKLPTCQNHVQNWKK